MGATGFFNPLTGFALAFRDKLGESAARERAIDLERQRMSSDERKQKGKNDSDERIADRRARSNETVADRQARAHEYGSDKDLEGRKYSADKMVEREKAAQGKISDSIMRGIQREADRREDAHKKAAEFYNGSTAEVDRINKGIEKALEKIPTKKPGTWTSGWKDVDLTPDELRQQKDLIIKKYLAEEFKRMPPQKRQYFGLAPDGQSVEFTGPEPEAFDRRAWTVDKMEEMGVRLEDRLGPDKPMIPVQPRARGGQVDEGFFPPPGMGVSRANPDEGFTPPSSGVSGINPDKGFNDGLQDGESIVTIQGIPYITNGKITVPIPRGMGRAFGVPGEVLNPPPVRDEMWGIPQDTPQISPYGVFFQ